MHRDRELRGMGRVGGWEWVPAPSGVHLLPGLQATGSGWSHLLLALVWRLCRDLEEMEAQPACRAALETLSELIRSHESKHRAGARRQPLALA